jgi:L-asparaginase
MKKIRILFCGGTIVMKEDAWGALKTPTRREAVSILRRIEPGLARIASFDIRYVANIDSTHMHPDHWDRLLDAIAEDYHAVDGFVITHGTDTMAYTAAALSVGIERLGKPVVLTGSQIPGPRIESDGRRNLVNAFRLALRDVAGVFVVFDERILAGARATKASESRLDAFTTVNADDAGEIRLDLHLHPGARRRRSGRIRIRSGFDPDIFIHTLTPGCDPGGLVFLLDNRKIHGIILQGYGTGNVPYDFEPFFRKAHERKVPVVVTSQCLEGRTMMRSYDVGRRALDLGVIEGYDQSLEMLAVKLMWALRHSPYARIRHVLQKNFSGELDRSYASP